MSSKELRVGVIGIGGRGWLVNNAHKPDSGSRVVAGADINEKTYGPFKEAYGDDVFITNDYKALLGRDDIDAVFVITPDNLHEEHAVAALEAGKHVYLEKPMAITVEGCDRILEAAFNNKRKIYVGHNMRHMPFTLKMKEVVDSGAIGEVKAGWCRHFVSYGGEAFFKDWHSERKYTNSLLLQKGAHDVDILHWLCGGFTKRVNAMGALTVYDKVTNRRKPSDPPMIEWNAGIWPPLSQRNLSPVIDVEDLSMMQMEFDNGVFASYEQCHFAPDAWRNFTIIGTDGRLENFDDTPGQCVIRVWNRRTTYNPYSDEQHFVPKVTGGHGGADPSIVNEFIGYVRDGGKITTSPISARYAAGAGAAAAYSLRNGGVPVDVPDLPQEWLDYFNADLV